MFSINFEDIAKKRNKGKSLLQLPNDYVVIDIETTDLDPRWGEIIEIGAVKVISNEITDTFSSLIKPSEPVDEFTTDLTGITNDMLDSAPDAVSVLTDFVQFIGNTPLVAHNANFDINFLYDNIVDNYKISSEFNNNFIDTLRISRWIFKDEKTHRLTDLADSLKLEHKPTHRGLDDCLCTYDLYKCCQKYVIENNFEFKFAKHNTHTLKASDISTQNTEFDETNPLYGKVCVFTGVLEKMVRKDAMQIVADLGGINADSITAKTNFLILGNNDRCKTIKDGKSSKQKKAEKLILAGKDLQIISENMFYDMIEDNKN